MPARQPTVAITGANGFLGNALAKHFRKKGWQVIALVRNPDTFSQDQKVTYRQYDLGKPLEDHILDDVDYLVHTAYIKYDHAHRDALNVNITSAQALLKASRKHKLKRVVFISSMSSHEQALSVYGKQKFAIEKLFDRPNEISLRPGLIIGNGGIVKSMAHFIQTKHVVPLIGNGRQPTQVIGLDDLVKIIEKSLVTPNLSGVLTVAHPQVIEYKQFYVAVAAKLKTKVYFVRVPSGLLIFMLKLFAWLHIRLDINEDNVRGLQRLRSNDTTEDLESLGVKVDNLRSLLAKVELA